MSNLQYQESIDYQMAGFTFRVEHFTELKILWRNQLLKYVQIL